MHIHACHTTCMEVREQSDHMGLVTKLSLVIRLGVKNFYPLTGQGSFWYEYEQTLELKLSHLCQCPSMDT